MMKRHVKRKSLKGNLETLAPLTDIVNNHGTDFSRESIKMTSGRFHGHPTFLRLKAKQSHLCQTLRAWNPLKCRWIQCSRSFPTTGTWCSCFWWLPRRARLVWREGIELSNEVTSLPHQNSERHSWTYTPKVFFRQKCLAKDRLHHLHHLLCLAANFQAPSGCAWLLLS